MDTNINHLLFDNKPFVGYNNDSEGVGLPFMTNQQETPFERTEKIMKERGIKAPFMQRKLGVLSQHWNNWKTRGIPANRIFDVANLLGVYPEWLKDGVGPKYKNNNKEKVGTMREKPNIKDNGKLTSLGSVPLISWEKLKRWCQGESVNLLESERWLPCPVVHGGSTFAITVSGDVMTSPYPGQRSYPDGTIIFVDPAAEVKSDCRVVAILDNCEPTFKEYREDAGKRYLMPLNPKYQPHQIDINNIRIIGVVVGTFFQE